MPIVMIFVKQLVIFMETIGDTMGHMSGGQNHLLPAIDMPKVGGPLSVVKVCTSMLCTKIAKIGYR